MISAIVLTKNEEKNIEKCIKSLLWCNELIIIDDYSTDTTVPKLRSVSNTAKIYKRHLNNDFAAQRNFGLYKAKAEWVLFVDADETIPEALASEIYNSQFTTSKEYSGFYIKRQDRFLGKTLKYGESGKIKLLRFGKKNAGKWKRKVHEYWDIKSNNTACLTNPIIHNRSQNLSDFILKLNTYSEIHAIELEREDKRSNIFKIIVWPTGKFLMNYFIKLGFLDGTPGFIMAIMMSFHSFLAWARLSSK